MVSSLRIARPMWAVFLLVSTAVVVLVSLGIAPGPGLFGNDPGATLTVRAKGSLGDEIMEIRVAGTEVGTFTVGTEWQEYRVETPSAAGAPDVEVAFVNDAYRPRDRNLIVDWVSFGGETYQAEAETTFSTGVWSNGGLCQPGYFGHEMLACSGYLGFGNLSGADIPVPVADDQSGTTIVVSAAGNVGNEMLEVLVDGVAVTVFRLEASANLFSEPNFVDYSIRLGDSISVDRVGLAFVNDRYQPGMDHNVRLKSVTIGDEVYGADAWVLENTPWANRSRCAPSWEINAILACNSALVADGTTEPAAAEAPAEQAPKPEPLSEPVPSTETTPVTPSTVPPVSAPEPDPVESTPPTVPAPKPAAPAPTTPVTPAPTAPVVPPPTAPAPVEEPSSAPTQPEHGGGHHPMPAGGDGSAYESMRNDDPKFSQFASVPSNQLSLDALTFQTSSPDNGSVGDGQFRAACEYSHFAYDDPIVYPGQPGKSHFHMFFGNTQTNAHTNDNSLINSGGSTCNGFELNRSAYWTPAVLDGQGNAVVPDQIILYYKTKQPGQVQAMPQGLKMVAGNTTGPSFTANQNLHWSCGDSGTSYNRSNTIPTNCNGDVINAAIVFPNCWDGRNLDSAGHQSHLKTIDENATCPSSHPVRLPQISILLYFPGGTNGSGWHLSSDAHHNAKPGSTLHADWYGAWNNQTMDLWTDGCMKAARNCSYGQTGTNRQLAKLNGLQSYEGSNFIPIP